MNNHLFVYGTLRHGCENEHAQRLAHEGDLVGIGHLPGRIYRLHRPGLEFPGLVAAENSDEHVWGDVFRLRQPDMTLAHLDEYEGELFIRDRAVVELDGGDACECWVYSYIGSVGDAERITDGKWSARW